MFNRGSSCPAPPWSAGDRARAGCSARRLTRRERPNTWSSKPSELDKLEGEGEGDSEGEGEGEGHESSLALLQLDL